MSRSDELASWRELRRFMSKREGYRLAHAREQVAEPRWWVHPVNGVERMEAWLVRQQIDAMCERISRGHARP